MNRNKLQTYEALFMKYFPKMKYFIQQLTKSPVVAEELTQDVFLKIWGNFDKICLLENPNAYIYRIARNTALDYISKKYPIEISIDELKEEQDYSIEEEYYAKELELLIELTVSQMPPQRKTIYELSRKEGLSNAEIAEQLNITKKTVENHLNLALKEIRKIIALFYLLISML